MRRMLCVLVFLLQAWWALAQDEEILRAARFLSGASSDEQVDEFWISRLEARQGRPVRINDARPRSDGLLSDYQLASLADYRSQCGDILSWEELSLVDGFSREWVEALRPFLSLASSRLPGAVDTVRVRAWSLLRGTLSSFGGKARATGGWWRAGGAWRGSDGTFYAEASWRGHRVLAGDYNTRFGQGLALWSGFSMSSLSTLEAFFRRAGAVSPVWSYSSASTHRGLAYEYSATHWRGSVFASLAGMAGGHAEWLGRYGQVGVTAATDIPDPIGHLTLSIDSRWNLRGADLAAELAWKNGSVAALAAFRRSVAASKLAFQLRMIPSRFSGKKNGEYAVAAGWSFQSGTWKPLAGRSGFGSSTPEHKASLTLDASMLPIPGTDPKRFQIRAYSSWQWQLASAWNLDLRFTERYRNYELSRHDLRADLHFADGTWQSVMRLENVFCERWGCLGYLEGGYAPAAEGSAFRVFLRLTGFRIDHWNDRIYCYERDAPGTFSVPAYSGRGGAVSLMGSWKHRFRHLTLKAYLRTAWMARSGRTPTYTLNLQLHCEL